MFVSVKDGIATDFMHTPTMICCFKISLNFGSFRNPFFFYILQLISGHNEKVEMKSIARHVYLLISNA
jgi:hypothetical protein